MRLIGILIVVAALAVVALAYFGMVDASGRIALTNKGQQTIQQGTNAAKKTAVEALDDLCKKVK
jgi:archaellin